MKLILSAALLLSGCGYMDYSPWSSNPEHKNLTAKHLARLERTNTDEFEPFKFVLTGDSQAVVEHMFNVVDVVNRQSDVAFIALAGDITDAGLLKEYNLIYRVVEESKKPLLTVVGNHDGLNNSKKIYREMFGPLNYSFVYKNIKFIMWNNNEYEWDTDFEFLEKELDSGHRSIIIAHQPPDGGTLSDAQEERWQNIRTRDNYAASLHAHYHKFSFRVEDGVPIYVVARVTDTMFATVTVTEDEVLIQNCTPLCAEPNEESK